MSQCIRESSLVGRRDGEGLRQGENPPTPFRRVMSQICTRITNMSGNHKPESLFWEKLVARSDEHVHGLIGTFGRLPAVKNG